MIRNQRTFPWTESEKEKLFNANRGWYIYIISWWFFYVHSNLNSLFYFIFPERMKKEYKLQIKECDNAE